MLVDVTRFIMGKVFGQYILERSESKFHIETSHVADVYQKSERIVIKGCDEYSHVCAFGIRRA